MSFDAIVIGSGFGGAVAACRLSEAGYRVLVLERGRRWTPETFPRAADDPWIWDERRPEACNGWFDIRTFPNMAVAQGAGVGGGSLVYANISCEAKPDAFNEGWPEAIDYETLKPHYDTVARVMDVREVPDNQWTHRMRLMRDAAAATGNSARMMKLELAVSFDPDWTYSDWSAGESKSKSFVNQHGAQQGTCVHLGNCDIGCEVNARNTLDLNYLYVAENNHGAEIRPLHLVTRISPDADGYRVDFDRIENGARRAGSETARLVFVCAGSLGSTELLLKCKTVHGTLPHVSARLGRNWSSNGDFLTPALHFDREVHADRGPTIASAIDFHDGSRNGRRFWIEDGGCPNLVAAYVKRKASDPWIGWKARTILQHLRSLVRGPEPLRHVMPWFAQGSDAADGTLSLRPPIGGGKPELFLKWDIRKSRELIDEIVATHRELAFATRGIPLVSPAWTLFQDLITPHPLGGCNMGDTAETGVVDACGEVFGHRNLFVLDGAVVPKAIGVNPTRTIAALAERAAKELVAQGR